MKLPFTLCGGMVIAIMSSCGRAQVAAPTITLQVDGKRLGQTGSLAEAVEMARLARRGNPQTPIVIQLPAGTIHLRAPIVLTQADAGTAVAPLVFRGQPDGSSVIAGSVTIATTGNGEIRVDDLNRVVPELRPEPAAAFSEGSEPRKRLFLFEGERRLDPSRWPASGYATGWTKATDASALVQSQSGMPPGDELVVDGFLRADWQHEAHAVHSDGQRLSIPDLPSLLPVQAIPRLRLLNVPGVLTRGSYALSHAAVRIRGFAPGHAIDIAVAPSLFTLDHADQVRFERIAFKKTTGTAIKIVQSSSVSITDCFIGLTGGYAVEADGGRDIRIDGCVVAHSAMGGFRLNGGDRTTLDPANHIVSNSAIVAFGQYVRSYSPGIALSGVGNSAIHNLIASAPHAGVILAGNDHVIDSNELHHLVCDTNDAGAIYMGRDWTQRGNRIVGNYIHDLGRSPAESAVIGVYLDDQFSGTDIAQNVFARMPHGILLGGGRDNSIHDNIFVSIGRSAILLDDRGLSWQSVDTAPGGLFRRQLDQSPYRTPLWKKRYPSLTTLLDDHPGSPIGNSASSNIIVGSTLLWANPMSLALPGTRNSIRAAPPGASSGSLRDIYSIIGERTIALPPGPTRALLYQSRMPSPGSCPS